MKQAMSQGSARANRRSDTAARRGQGPRDGLALVLLGGLLLQGWLRWHAVYRRRQQDRPAAKPAAVQRWEGEGGQPLPDPPPDAPPHPSP